MAAGCDAKCHCSTLPLSPPPRGATCSWAQGLPLLMWPVLPVLQPSEPVRISRMSRLVFPPRGSRRQVRALVHRRLRWWEQRPSEAPVPQLVRGSKSFSPSGQSQHPCSSAPWLPPRGWPGCCLLRTTSLPSTAWARPQRWSPQCEDVSSFRFSFFHALEPLW